MSDGPIKSIALLLTVAAMTGAGYRSYVCNTRYRTCQRYRLHTAKPRIGYEPLLGHVYFLFIIIYTTSFKSICAIMVNDTYFETISSGVEPTITSAGAKTKDDARASG
jgi:hypothetical protein